LNKINYLFFGSLLIFINFCQPVFAESDESWYSSMRKHVTDTWNDGKIELYIPLKTIHMPFAYSHEQRDHLNENPLGLGIGKGRYNSSGNYEGMLVMVFQDSHSKPEYLLGYSWIPMWSFQHNIKAGAGIMGFVSARSDFGHYIPFPGALPVATISYKNLSLQTTYIPRLGPVSGNVIFTMLKWTFD
jgi:palmitoyl transferase